MSCYDCPTHERLSDAIKTLRAESEAELKNLRDEIERLNASRDFYRRRCDLLQKWQHRMRDPERMLVCDILANGQTLPDVAGTRYPNGETKKAACCGLSRLLSDLADDQAPLGSEFEKIWDDNVDKLYED